MCLRPTLGSMITFMQKSLGNTDLLLIYFTSYCSIEIFDWKVCIAAYLYLGLGLFKYIGVLYYKSTGLEINSAILNCQCVEMIILQ